MVRPGVRYAKSGDLNIAYQVVGDGKLDIVFVSGFISHLDLLWESPASAQWIERMASFGRVILFDKRGVGLSDPVSDVPTLEERMDDVRAVMDAAGSEQAALVGMSEGGMMSILFSSTYPERTRALILYGAMARSTWSEDYPWGAPADDLMTSNTEFIGPHWGEGATIEIFAPSLAELPEARDLYAKLERQGASPQMAFRLFQMFLDLDVRPVLGSIQAPVLILHRKGDRVVNVRAGRYLAENIPGAKYVELEGADHNIFAGDSAAIFDEIEEFLTGARPGRVSDRILATVLFTDVVGSTEKAVEVGDQAWGQILKAHQEMVRKELLRFRGKEINTTGDGFLASFDGPARAIRCAAAIAEGVQQLGIEVRAGVHTGECEVMGDDLGGIAVHTASRICNLADPSVVLVSRTVRDLVAGSGITFADRGSYELKGVPDKWQLFAIVGS